MSRYIKGSFDYDSEFDILNIYLSDSSNSIGDEDVDNIIEFRDLVTNEITRIMIIKFKNMIENKDPKLKLLKNIVNYKDLYTKLTRSGN